MKNEEMSTQTKNSLAAALKKRMETTEFSKIRVSDLLKDCNIVRSTFYYYFSDIYELLEWMLNTELIVLFEKCDEIYTWDQGVTMLMEYVRDNSKMCICAFHSIGRESLERMIYKNCYVGVQLPGKAESIQHIRQLWSGCFISNIRAFFA